MKVGIVQLDIIWEEKEQNFLKVEKLINKKKDCDLIVLPEMFNTGFSMNPDIAENKGGKTEKFLSELAYSLNTHILAGYVIKSDGKLKNIASLFSKNGKIISTYSKIHLFSLLKENKVFESGKIPVIFHINKIPCSVFICYDLRFPELFRFVSKKVYVIFVIANWPASRAEHWKSLLRARAIENQVYTIGVNRVGFDGNGIFYIGNSLVFDPWGEKIIEADENEQFIECVLNIKYVREIRKKYPFLYDSKFITNPLSKQPF
ncbi:MAG: carbon-nitrogen family hydrolase [Thermodesulfovibrio sp.]|nr:carbon-nitrogen family hydrolase [Thermodesulfovibrio sp.]